MTDLTNILSKLTALIEKNKAYIVDGALNRNLLAADARKYDTELLNLLQQDKELKEHFFAATDGGLVFKKDVFLQFIMNKEFLPDSYTKYKIKIGLGAEDGSLLSESGDVVLNWPYKDAILEGGQDKEDQKRSEVFFNEVLAPDQITRLLDDKVFTNWKRYDKDGVHDLDELRNDDNLLIRGNNLVVLHSLKKSYGNKVKLIYIDPPYNTGKDSFGYNDRFNHSTWLTFMKNRLEVARDLLSSNGSIFISLDDTEVHYAKVMCDEIFGRDNFIASIIWHSKYTTSNDAKYMSYQHENILCYAKDKSLFEVGLLERSDELNKSYRNPDNDPKGPWKATPIHAKSGSDSGRYEIVFPSGYKWTAPTGRYPRYSKSRLLSIYEEGGLYFNSKGGVDKKTYLSEVKQGVTPGTVWSYEDAGHTHGNNEELAQVVGKGAFDNPKGTKLIKKILRVGKVQDGDIVLDYHAGSGTTGQAVMDYATEESMNLKFIMIEQMEYAESLTAERIKKTQGDGSFVYTNIMNNANKFRKHVEAAKNDVDYLELLNEATASSFLSYRIDPKKLNEEEFRKLSSSEKRRLLLELIDNNSLYVNYEDMNDPSFKISEKDKEFNKKLYEKN